MFSARTRQTPPARPRHSVWIGSCLLAFPLVIVAPAAAQQVKSVSAVAPPGAGQPALAVGFDSAGTLRAAVCPRASCRVDGGQSLDLPAEAQPLVTAARLQVIRIGAGRHAIHVEVPDPSHQRAWEAVVFAQPGAPQPAVPFAGWTGLVQGQDGERKGPMVVISDPLADGSRRLAIGEQHEALTLCGRPAVISPRLLNPKDLKLHSAKVQRLSAADRAGATVVTARRLPTPAAPSNHPVLRAVAATSAVGQPKALTDGDPNTTWAENRGREGRGEFLLMQAPGELPIEAFEFVIRPAEGEVEHGVSPKEFYLVTTPKVFAVRLEEDAWAYPGALYEVQLDQPVQTDCVALVTETAFQSHKEARVTFAELRARTALAATDLPTLVASLKGGGPSAEAAGAALRSLGPDAFEAVAVAYDTLDEDGRRVALDVIDHAECRISAPVYVRALLGRFEAHRLHASARLRRCAADATEKLVEALDGANAAERDLIANELALAAPGRAVEVLVPRLAKAKAKQRAALRVVIARAAASDRARDAVLGALGDARLSEVAHLDLLRALGDRLAQYGPAATAAFARLASPKASFRIRYLLLEPAAALATTDPSALAYLRRSLAVDPDAHIRAQAARMVSDPGPLQRELERALWDPGVRVREAVLRALSSKRGAFAGAAIATRLKDDPWPLVRAAAADALGELGPGAAHDRALFEALGDESRHVRSPVLRALGRRGARQYAAAVRERLGDSDEELTVRVAAAEALGRMCDAEAVDELTDYAMLLRDPMGAGPTRAIAPAALRALGRIRPPDLAQRLQPLLGKEAPTLARQAAQDALRQPSSCGR